MLARAAARCKLEVGNAVSFSDTPCSPLRDRHRVDSECRDTRQHETVAKGARPARVSSAVCGVTRWATGRRARGRSARFPAAAPAETLCRSLKGEQGFGRLASKIAGSEDHASENQLGGV